MSLIIVSADALNAMFEFGGAIAVFMSVVALWKAKEWKGLSPWNMIFFNTWGVWNLYFYSHLSQPLSMVAGMCLQTSNLLYLYLLWKFRNGGMGASVADKPDLLDRDRLEGGEVPLFV